MMPKQSASPAKSARVYCALILAATMGALVLRLPLLQMRPMHGDEAVHAYKFGDLLEKGVYTYDPNEYHGPTLNYFTLIPTRLSGAGNLTQVTEWTLRIVPVFFGVLLVALFLLMTDGLGRAAAAFAAILTAISPAIVFYSRYYIQEMLLVCFTFGAIVCGYRYAQSKSIIWALCTGVFLGLMHATKETCVIAFGSMLVALLITLALSHRQRSADIDAAKPIKVSQLIAGFLAAVVVSALFYSSFFSNPAGFVDSLQTYGNYFSRVGHNAIHIHPWHYYLKMLIYSRYNGGPIWSEGFIIVLALIGVVVAIRARGISGIQAGFYRFIAFYTIIMTVIYSAIPYKTPWCLLGFLHGMILLAGIGGVAIVRVVPNVLPRLIVLCLLFEASVLLLWQSHRANFIYYADYHNPYVYAHPTTDVFAMVARVEEIAQFSETGRNMNVKVICPAHDYWPLPWYLRSFGNIEWTDRVYDNVISVPLIIASPSVEQELLGRLYQLPPPGEKQLYVPLFDTYMELRPGVELRGYVTQELWSRYRQQGVPDALKGAGGRR